jgi:hypothetical protein
MQWSRHHTTKEALMLTTVRGISRQGRVELSEDPNVTDEVPVVVTFLEDRPSVKGSPGGRIMTFGILAVPGKAMSTEADFTAAEYDDSRWDRD